MSPKGSRRAVQSGLWLGLSAGILLALFDGAEALLRLEFATVSDALSLVLLEFATLAAAGALLGAVAGSFALVGAQLAARRHLTLFGSSTAPSLLAVPLAAPSLFIELDALESAWGRLGVWERAAGVGLLAATAGAAFVCARLLLASPSVRTPQTRAVVGGLFASGAALLLFLDRSLPDELYAEAHALSAIHAALATVVAVRWLARWPNPAPPSRRGFAAAATVPLVALAVLEVLDVKPLAATDTLIYGKLIGPLRRITDFDRDGSSSFFAGRDCRALDARFAPRNLDVPGNGRDEDCSGSDAEPHAHELRAADRLPAVGRHNVVWISIDALRPDHVGAYGYTRSTTPNIDRLANAGVRFERAYAQSTGTWDSVPSMLSGSYPHGLDRDYDHPSARAGKRWYSYRLGAETRLLSERLAERGYATAGFASFRVFDWLGFERRFATYERTEEHAAKGRAFVTSAPEPFFLWHHLPYPHEPYEKQAGFDFGDRTVDRYDSEIGYSDWIVGEILAGLGRRGIAERTIVVVTADHGEAFGEHRRRFHGRSCYDEQARVPLLVHVPGRAPAVVREPVELVGLVPTLLELVGVPFDSSEIDGTSLFARFPAAGPEGAYCEYVERSGITLAAVATPQWKLISDYRRDRLELYALGRDPRELVNVVELEPDVRERLLAAIARRRTPLMRTTH